MAYGESQQVDWMIEQAVPEDAGKIAILHSESFKKAYLTEHDDEYNEKIINLATQFVTPDRIMARTELLAHSLGAPDKHFYHIAMRDDSRPIGLIYGTKTQEKQEIEALYVDENYFGAGLGQALVDRFIEWADPTKPIELGVHKDNERAKRFYIKMGFEALNDDRQSYFEEIPETTMLRQPQNTQGETK